MTALLLGVVIGAVGTLLLRPRSHPAVGRDPVGDEPSPAPSTGSPSTPPDTSDWERRPSIPGYGWSRPPRPYR